MTDCESSFFWWKNSEVCSCTEHFQQFKTPQLPFYFPMAPQNHVYTWCFSTVCRITQGSVRRCRSLTPHCQGNVRHYPLHIFQIKTITARFTCGATTGIPSRLFVWYTLQSKISSMYTFVMDSEQSKSVETSDLGALTYCFAFWRYRVRTKSRIQKEVALQSQGVLCKFIFNQFPILF